MLTDKQLQQRAELEKQVAAARVQVDELSLRLAAAQRDVRVATERQQKEQQLAAELEQINAESAQLKLDNERMRAEVAEFPTETQVLKLERRVESLKDAIGKYDSEIAARVSAVEAYRVRRDKCAAATLQALESVRGLCVERGSLVDRAVEADARVHAAPRIERDLAAMLEIAGDREAALARLIEARDAKAEEDQRMTAVLVDLQGREEREAPVIDSDAAKHAQAITDAWQGEQQALLRTYDKLRQVNREQEFHIARGSHVKREDSTPYAMYHEVALSNRQGHLATQLNETREHVELLRAENAFSDQKLGQTTRDAREARGKLEKQREEAEAALAKAVAEREAADAETARFRALRWELQDALRAVRNAPALTSIA
jgi:hypothetical protein